MCVRERETDRQTDRERRRERDRERDRETERERERGGFTAESRPHLPSPRPTGAL